MNTPSITATLNTLPYGFFQLDAGDCVVLWNQCLARWTGLAPGAATGRSIRELFPGAHRFMSALASVRASGQPRVLSQFFHGYSIPIDLPENHLSGFRRMQQDCQIVPLPEPAGHMAVTIIDMTSVVVGQRRARDLTAELVAARNQAEQMLRDLSAQKLALDEHSIVTITDPGGIITYVNDKFCAVSKFAREELLGRDHRVINSGHHPREFFADLWQTVSSGRVWKGEVKNRARDGSSFWADTTIVPTLNAAGKPTQYIAIRADITERKRVEVELRQAKDLAEAASLAKSEFLATMSHEIRTPMNGVIGFTNLLLDTPLTVEQRDFVDTIQASGQNLLAIVNDILDFSKIESGQVRLEHIPYDLGRAAGEVISLLSAQARSKGLALLLRDRTGGHGQLMGDPCRVRQVLLNLAGNAVKFTQTGGVTVELEMEPPPGPNGQRFVRVSVTDTGIGIPADKQAGLFQRFVQADSSTTRRFGGTGLGLAICKRLVELMGGSIGLTSALGQGSTFWFTLPTFALEIDPDSTSAEPSDAGPAALSPSAQRVRPNGVPTFRVLLVDDDIINQRLARHHLENWGYRVDVAGCGVEAVAMFRQLPYDLVLVDCQLSDLMDGCAVARAIRRSESQPQRVPIIALTTGAQETDRHPCLEAGMDDFMAKPVDAAELQRVLEKWSRPRTADLRAS